METEDTDRTLATMTAMPTTSTGPGLMDMPGEILDQIFCLLSLREKLQLGKTCWSLANRAIPLMHEEEARGGRLHLALAWACWFGVLSVAQAALSAGARARRDVPLAVRSKLEPVDMETMRRRGRSGAVPGRPSLIQGRPVKVRPTDARAPGDDKMPRGLLHMACLRGNTAIAELLFEYGASVHDYDEANYTPLHYACNEEVARFLVNRGAYVDAARNGKGTPLANLISWGPVRPHRWEHEPLVPGGSGALDPSHNDFDVTSAIRYLIQDAGAETFANNWQDHHPLEMAVRRRNVHAVKLLLQAGASMSPRDKKGRKKLMLTIALEEYDNLSVIDALLKAGCDVDETEPYVNCRYDRPILRLWWLDSYAKHYTGDKSEFYDAMSRICERVRDVNEKFGGHPAIYYYLDERERRIDIARVLVQHGADWKLAGIDLDQRVLDKLLDTS